MTGVYGKPKVDATAERIRAINPLCDCRKIEDFIEVETAESFLPEDAIILDCIDNVKVKAAMAAVCKKRKQFMVACGAAGGKTSAMNIIHEDLARKQERELRSSAFLVFTPQTPLNARRECVMSAPVCRVQVTGLPSW